MVDRFDDLMREADPAKGQAPLPVDRREAILTAARRRDERLDPRRPRWGRRLAVAASVLAVAAGGLVVQSVTGAAPSAEAQGVLDRAALIAKDPAARPGQYWRITRKSEHTVGYEAQGGQFVCVLAENRVSYVSVDGSRPSWFVDEPRVRLRQLLGSVCPTAPGGTWTTPLAPNLEAPTWGNPTPSWLAGLPRDPAALRARLYADSAGQGSGPDDEAFVTVADILRSGVVPADLRSALFRVLQTVPGTTITDKNVQAGGRAAIAVGRGGAGEGRSELLFAVGTGDFVGERWRRGSFEGFPNGSVSTYSRDVVDALPADLQRLKCTPEGECR